MFLAQGRGGLVNEGLGDGQWGGEGGDGGRVGGRCCVMGDGLGGRERLPMRNVDGAMIAWSGDARLLHYRITWTGVNPQRISEWGRFRRVFLSWPFGFFLCGPSRGLARAFFQEPGITSRSSVLVPGSRNPASSLGPSEPLAGSPGTRVAKYHPDGGVLSMTTAGWRGRGPSLTCPPLLPQVHLYPASPPHKSPPPTTVKPAHTQLPPTAGAP